MTWWKKAVIYQIYPRSFQDSNGDGIGDIPGIISRLDYLQHLGIRAIWLCPVYASPNDDNGYDVSNYLAIHPDFGTMDDMDRLIKEARKRDIRIIMDLVVNHSSDEHQWFIESKSSSDSPYRDYYVWRDPVDGKEPNDLQSFFGGSAWEFDEDSGQYYLHLFSKKQPDLNWENKDMRMDTYDMIKTWLDKGIGGFRLDVIDLIGKKPDEKILGNGPKMFDYIEEMNRESFGQYDAMTVGEIWGARPENAADYADPNKDRFSKVLMFEHLTLDEEPGKAKWDLAELDFIQLKKVFNHWQTNMPEVVWTGLFWNNHDTPRIVSRFGNDGEYREESAKMLAILLHMMKGTPYIYQGEEIGMTNHPISDISQARDIETLNLYHERLNQGYSKEDIFRSIHAKGRDNARTPMQWEASEQGGFTTGSPWIDVNENVTQVNVESNLDDPSSVFHTYRKLIQLRNEHLIITEGDFELVMGDHPQIFAYERSYEGQTWLVVANFSDTVCEVNFSENKAASKVILSNTGKTDYDLSHVRLEPYETFVVEK
ncbi:alpha-glucosidase [Alkalibacterium iburiense]|uniref:Alpha-glucosidase n=1 Tax=Alkalibacterium iburiense TaxID=290589 RepID=A0ABN0XDX3_9LACT